MYWIRQGSWKQARDSVLGLHHTGYLTLGIFFYLYKPQLPHCKVEMLVLVFTLTSVLNPILSGCNTTSLVHCQLFCEWSKTIIFSVHTFSSTYNISSTVAWSYLSNTHLFFTLLTKNFLPRWSVHLFLLMMDFHFGHQEVPVIYTWVKLQLDFLLDIFLSFWLPLSVSKKGGVFNFLTLIEIHFKRTKNLTNLLN